MLQGINIPNIGGYDDNAFKDRKAVSIVSERLAASDCIMPHIASSDTVPNQDGYIEVCEKSGNCKIPVATFVVQVKSLPVNYLNQNKCLNKEEPYKYCCDTKAFNIALYEITLNPVLLIMVDIRTKDIFWKHLSHRYCEKLKISNKRNITIFFGEKDKILDEQKWSLELKRIYDAKRSTIIPIDDPIPEEIQHAFDTLNNTLDNELAFIKRTFFQNTWKLGLSYFMDSESKFKSLGIYRIPNGQNDAFIKDFKQAHKINFVEIDYYGHSASNVVEIELTRQIDLLFKEKNYFLCIMPDMVIQDIIFDILDSYFSTKTLRNADINSHEKVILGYPDDTISLIELQRILTKEALNHKESLLLQCCIKELLVRDNFKYCHRWWSRRLKGTIVKTTNGVRADFEDDVLPIAKDNLERFLRNFAYFCKETVRRLGNKTQNLFDSGNYTIHIDKNLHWFAYTKKIGSELNFKWSFESKTSRELSATYERSLSETYTCGECAIHPQLYVTYNWYDIWRVWCYRTFLQFIVSSKDVYSPFLDVLHYIDNCYEDSPHYILTSADNKITLSY